tara:strand:+ start:190 stop:867 length:678 start_codon:yes stop_codon:yes gene_type:complete
MTNHPFESFSLSGLDTGKVGNNKFIDYKVSDYLKDQNLKTSPRSIQAALKQLDLDANLLKEVPSTTALGKVERFLGNLTGRKGPRDYYLPKSITDTLENAEKMKQEEISNDPLSIENLEKLKAFNLDLIREQDKISRKGRLADTGLELAMQRAQLPYLANFYKDISASKQRELLEAEKIKQGLPQQIQERIGQSALTAAAMGNMIANQTDSATRMAQAGTGLKFG